MNIWKRISYLPYQITWHLKKRFHPEFQADFLCGGYVDYICFRSIHKLLPEVRIVARNKKTYNELTAKNIKAVIYPTYPDLVIMARHLAHKYPVKRIVKIGMRHGAYHFKDFVAPERYNAFDKYLFTSSHEVELALQKGIVCGVAVGFPKLDPIFNHEITANDINKIRTELKLDPEKKTVLFSATWDKKGYSAIDKWIYRIEELADKYNILVTVHHWTSEQYKRLLLSYQKIHYIQDKDILPYLVAADVMVGDTSSIIAEFCALDKTMITFRVEETKRFTSEIRSMLEEISYRIDNFEELRSALQQAVLQPDYHTKARKKYNKIMFDELDGKAANRSASYIKEYWR